MSKEPTTFQQAIIHFANPYSYINLLVARRLPDGVGSRNLSSDILKIGSYINEFRSMFSEVFVLRTPANRCR